MARFDVFRSSRGGTYPLVIDVQADLHTKLTTRLVVPLVPRAKYATQILSRLTPVLRVRSDDYVLVFPLMAALPVHALGERVGSLAVHRAVLIAALDLLLTGG